jgi:hypothetical protein
MLKSTGIFVPCVNFPTQSLPDPEPYSFVNFGIFYFGIELPTYETYYITSKGIVYNFNILTRGDCELRVQWEPTQPGLNIQISWFQFYISRVFIVTSTPTGQNKCYSWDYLENTYYATVYNPPSNKNFKHVWMNAVNIYCSTLDRREFFSCKLIIYGFHPPPNQTTQILLFVFNISVVPSVEDGSDFWTLSELKYNSDPEHAHPTLGNLDSNLNYVISGTYSISMVSDFQQVVIYDSPLIFK